MVLAKGIEFYGKEIIIGNGKGSSWEAWSGGRIDGERNGGVGSLLRSNK